MIKQHHLLLKQHRKTGLKYLCYHYGTVLNCFKYRGSGSYWTSHIRKHGSDIFTSVLYTTSTQEELATHGLFFSALWDIVKSNVFANLTVECCQTTAEPLRRPEVIRKRLNSIKDRRQKLGLTEKEILSRRKGVLAMQDPDVRRRAALSYKNRLNAGQLTEKEIKSRKRTTARRQRKEFTLSELKGHNKISKNQSGKSMSERLGRVWVNPRKGRSADELYGESWVHSSKGKTSKEIHGSEWVDKRAKPFVVTSKSHGECYYECESDFFKKTQYPEPSLRKLKQHGSYTIKRQKNSRHIFLDGETIYFNYVS